MAASTQLSIIIISYNTKQLLKNALDSIPANSSWEIIVVDNASTDGSVEMLEQDYPQVILITNRTNRGFAAANNRAIKIARGRYLLLLNSDTEIIGDAIEQLLHYLGSHPQAGAITPKLLLPDGAIDLACHRGLPTPWNAFTYFAKLEQLLPQSRLFGGYHQTHLDFTTTHPVAATSATAMMVRHQVIDQIGGLDERFFFYAEDLDWCKRITEAGWQIIYHPQATVLHLKSRSGKKRLLADASSSAAQTASTDQFYHTMKQFYDKHYSRKYPRWLRRLVFAGIDLKNKLSRRQ